jgi:hypothetical protein
MTTQVCKLMCEGASGQPTAASSAAPWLKADGTTSAAPPASISGPQTAGGKPATAAAAHTPPPNGQRAGFFIRPQLPKSKLGRGAAAAAPPAYVKVAEKPAEQQPSAATAAGGQGSKNWPPSLRAYVERAFAQCKGDGNRAQLQEALRRIITDAQAKGEMWTRSWDTTPLPTCVAPQADSSAAAAAAPAPTAPLASWADAHRAASFRISAPRVAPRRRADWCANCTLRQCPLTASQECRTAVGLTMQRVSWGAGLQEKVPFPRLVQ